MHLPVIVDDTHSAPIGVLPGFRFVSGGIAIGGTVLIFDNGVEREEPSRPSWLQRNNLIAESRPVVDLDVRVFYLVLFVIERHNQWLQGLQSRSI